MFASVVPVICFDPQGVNVHEAKRRNMLVRSICGIPVCVLHKQTVTLQDVMNKEAISGIFDRIGRAPPDLDNAWLEWEEVEKGMALIEEMKQKGG